MNEDIDRRDDTEGRRTDDLLKAEKAKEAEGYKQIAATVPQLTYNFAKLVIVGMVVQLAVIGYVFITEHNGRVDQVNATREGCERDKLDRAANARGWRIAEDARREVGQTDVANDYRDIAEPMEKRSQIDCFQRYPDARFFP